MFAMNKKKSRKLKVKAKLLCPYFNSTHIKTALLHPSEKIANKRGRHSAIRGHIISAVMHEQRLITLTVAGARRRRPPSLPIHQREQWTAADLCTAVALLCPDNGKLTEEQLPREKAVVLTSFATLRRSADLGKAVHGSVSFGHQ